MHFEANIFESSHFCQSLFEGNFTITRVGDDPKLRYDQSAVTWPIGNHFINKIIYLVPLLQNKDILTVMS